MVVAADCIDNTMTSIPLHCINDMITAAGCPTSSTISSTTASYPLTIAGIAYNLPIANSIMNISSAPGLTWGGVKAAITAITGASCSTGNAAAVAAAVEAARVAATADSTAAAAAALVTSAAAASTGSNVSNISISDILAKIQTLQTTEQSLISTLDAYVSAAGGYVATDPNIIKLIAQINSIADARIAMFKTISANADLMQTGVSQSRIDLVSQMTLLKVVEDQLNQAKEKIQQLSNRNDTQMRMVEINTYYGQRYEALSKLMKKIILVCLPILILFILKKVGILPATLGKYIIGIVIAIGSIIIIRAIWDIYTRNNNDFSSYDWKYEQPNAQIPSIWQYNKDNMFDYSNLFNNLMANVGSCLGDSCCAPGTVYDSTKFQCIVPPLSSGADPAGAAAKLVENARRLAAQTAGFTSGNGLRGSVIGSYRDDDKNDFNGITPFSPVMEFASVN